MRANNDEAELVDGYSIPYERPHSLNKLEILR